MNTMAVRSWTLLGLAGLALGLGACAPETKGSEEDADEVETKGDAFGPELTPLDDSPETLERVSLTALRTLTDRAEELGIDGPEDEVEIVRVEVDDLALAHARVQQRHGGIPVFGGEAIVHLDSRGRPSGELTDEIVRRVSVGRGARPTLSGQDVIDGLLRDYGDRHRIQQEPTAELMILRHEGVDHLVWKVEWLRMDEVVQEKPILFVDAHSGELVWGYDDVQRAVGQTRYDGFRYFPSTYVAAKTAHTLEDTGRKIGAYDQTKGTTTASRRVFDTDNVWDAANLDAVSAIWTVSVAVDYARALNQSFGWAADYRLPIGGVVSGSVASADGSTMLLPVYVHVPHPDPTKSGWNNASFTGSINVGDGDGTWFSPLVSVDILAHEFAHGIVAASSGLVYGGEPGALNESFADIFGAMVERSVYGESPDVWRIGEDAWTPSVPGDAMRNMTDPGACGDPDHISEFQTFAGASDRDSGGVHTNSSIPNRVFTLVANGGTHSSGASRAVTGIGPDKALRIWYRAYQHYLLKKSDFRDAYVATVQAANTEFGWGSPEARAVELAWGLVGVTTYDDLRNGDFTAGSTEWTLEASATVAAANAYYWNSSALRLGGADDAPGAARQTITLPASPSTAALTLYGVIETVEEPWPYDWMSVNVRDGWGNQLETLITLTNVDQGYFSVGPFDLSAYAGQMIEIEVVAATDWMLPTTFWIEGMEVAVSANAIAPESIGDGNFERFSLLTPLWHHTGYATKVGSSDCFAGYCFKLGVFDYGTAMLDQDAVTIPSSSPGILTFRLRVDSEESPYSTTPWDKLQVEVIEWGDTTGTVVKTYSNLDEATGGFPYSTKTIDLSAYKGSTIHLKFNVQNDSTLPTTFYIDDVSLK